jgi:uncharacterized protein
MPSTKSTFFLVFEVKYTLSITQKCNLACDYCYVNEKDSVMPLPVAGKIIDFIYDHTPEDEQIDIGFFGGEPLLELRLIKEITQMINHHESYDADRVMISIVTNGTIFHEGIKDFLLEENVGIGISCDGPSFIQDQFRRFPDGSGSSKIVEGNIEKALLFFPFMPVNAVYSPENLQFLPDIVDYISELGVKNIYLNHNISAHWTSKEARMLQEIYGSIGKKYLEFYRRDEPRHISLIDSKIVVILRGGYKPLERCRMGTGELAFSPTGNIYPCERLIGSDDGSTHCIGNINHGFTIEKNCKTVSNEAENLECQTCSLRKYCMNWCGCTNFFSTSDYRKVGPFVCASEKAAIKAASQVLQTMQNESMNLSEHLGGTPLMSIIGEVMHEPWQKS